MARGRCWHERGRTADETPSATAVSAHTRPVLSGSTALTSAVSASARSLRTLASSRYRIPPMRTRRLGAGGMEQQELMFCTAPVNSPSPGGVDGDVKRLLRGRWGSRGPLWIGEPITACFMEPRGQDRSALRRILWCDKVLQSISKPHLSRPVW